MSKRCRLCLRQDDNSESLLEISPDDLISKALVEIFDLKAEKSDTKPKDICAWCKEKLLDFYLFYLGIKSNERKLEREAVALKIKTEPGMAPVTPTVKTKAKPSNELKTMPKLESFLAALDSENQDDTIKEKEVTTQAFLKPIQVKIEPGTEKKRKAADQPILPKSKKTKGVPIIPIKTPPRLSLKLFNHPTSQYVEENIKESPDSQKSKNTLIILNKDHGPLMIPKIILKRLPSNTTSNHIYKLKESSPETVKPVKQESKPNISKPNKYNSTPLKSDTKSVSKMTSGFAEKLKLLKKNHESMSEEQMIKVFYDLKCNICEMELEFYSFQALAEHYKTDHQEENYRVECCGVKIPRNLLLIHIRHHLGLEKLSLMQHVEQLKTQFFCDLCSKAFAKDYILRLHMKFDHGPGKVVKAKKKIDKQPYVCDLCGRTFPHINNIRVHIKTTHLKLSVYSCDICNIGFRHYKQLESHKLKQHAIKPKVQNTTCHICEKPGLKKKVLLESHLQSHLSAEEKKQLKKFNCNYCEFKSILKYKVKVHESKRHSNKKPDFECYVCHKFFGQRLQFHYHLVTHLDKDEQDKLKPHQCLYCDMRFFNESVVHAHISSHHRCSICKQIVKPPQTMGDHNREAHEKYFASTKNEKRSYTITGKYMCEYCDKPFRYHDSFQKHLQEWHLGGMA